MKAIVATLALFAAVSTHAATCVRTDRNDVSSLRGVRGLTISLSASGAADIFTFTNGQDRTTSACAAREGVNNVFLCRGRVARHTSVVVIVTGEQNTRASDATGAFTAIVTRPDEGATPAVFRCGGEV